MRYDAEYYKPEYLESEEVIEAHKSFTVLNKVAKKIKKIFNPEKNPEGEFFYIEIDDINLVDGRYSYKTIKNYDAPSRARKFVRYGDILVSTVRPNRNAISLFLEKKDNFVCSTGFSVIKSESINPYFLFALLKTKFVINQLVRKTSAAMYPAVSEEDIFNLKIINPSSSFQEKIESKIKLAYQKEEEADRIYKEAEIKLLNILKYKEFKISSEKTNIISFRDFNESLRLDARFFLPKYEDAIEILNKSGHKILKISEIIRVPIKSGATPLAGTNAYIEKEEGIPFYRIVNIKDFELTNEDLLYIRPDIHESLLKRSKLIKGDVLFSIAGTIGICVVVPSTIKEGNINQALAIIRLNKDFNPYYVSLYFNSVIGKLISEKISRPVVQTNINLSELGTLMIPKIPSNTQQEIAKLVCESFELRKEGKNLIKETIIEIENKIID